MHIIFAIIGTVFSVIGSILLSIRVKILLNWISLVLRAHETCINAITQVINNPTKSLPVLLGTTKKLETINETKGQRLFIIGLFFIAVGVVFQILGIYFRVQTN